MIAEETLIAWGATYKNYHKGETIFVEGGQGYYYHQLVEGRVTWFNRNDDGKEFIQSIIEAGEPFGELPMFDDEPYAASAMASEEARILRLPKQLFLQLLHENTDIHFNFSRLLAQRLRFKFKLLELLAYECPEKRVSTLFNYFKKKKQDQGDGQDVIYHVDLTRQQIANMTGLRVETVIRVIRNMNKNGTVDIDHGKVSLRN